ncbi:hypothetical protein NMG60_11004625 [Bertholletia excelsa]
MDEDQRELQLLPATASSSRAPPWPAETSSKFRPPAPAVPYDSPSLDLQLSISVRPIKTSSSTEHGGGRVEALRWQAAEQVRLAAMEKAYAERVRELSRREMELAQSEFARARQMWERAREEVEKAERMKERATRQGDSTCMEITCQSCRQKFRP